ncbi:hypothetical protein QEN19_001198 [Hanseniaspora menglaensis]
MAKRRSKNRTHVPVENDKNTSIPKSICIRLGSLAMKNKSLKQLTHDFRLILSPHTAIRLKELNKNKLKDFIVMCSPLNVTHLFTFTQSANNENDIYLKLGKLHNGPTVTFKVNEYSLLKDINRFKNKSINTHSLIFQEPPLLVINGFKSDIPQEKIIISLFQNIYPPINPMQKKIEDIKRVLLVNKLEDGTVEIRHYMIVIKDLINKADVKAKNIDKLLRLKNDSRRTIPNLKKKKDISSLVLEDLGYMTSDNESDIEEEQIIKQEDEIKQELEEEDQALSAENNEDEELEIKDDEDSDVEIKDEEDEEQTLKKQKLNNGASKRQSSNKKAIKLQEIGPRLSLSLLKIESDLFKGETLYHSFIKKSTQEIQDLQKRHDEKVKLKEQRKKEQEANLLKKKEVKEEKKRRKDERRKIRKEQNEESDKEGSEDKGKSVSEDESSSEDEYADIPEDIDSDLLSEIDENPSDDE